MKNIPLVLFGLCPLAVSCANQNSYSSFSSSETIKDKYHLDLKIDKDISISTLDSEYKPSSLVVFSLTSEKYERFDVNIFDINNEKIDVTGTNPYSFVMPNKDIKLFVTSYSDNLAHDVYIYESSNCYIELENKQYKKNELVSFNVNPNYNSNLVVKVYDSYQNEISLSSSGSIYSFVMPSRPAYIYVNNEQNEQLINNIVVKEKDSSISFTNYKPIYNEGETISFKIKQSISGVINVQIKDKNDDIIPYLHTSGIYTFSMPNDYCVIETSVTPYTNTALDNQYLANNYNKLVIDSNFNKGFVVRKWENYGDYEFNNHLNIYPNTNEPKWHLTQWMTDYEINTDDDIFYQNDVDIDRHAISSGEYYDQLAKTIEFNSKTGELSFTSNAQYEYSNCTNNPPGKPTRASGYSDNFWVHLLLEQAYFRNELVYINEYDEMIMDTTFTVSKNIQYKDYYSDCAQFEWYLSIQNRNKDADILYEKVMRNEMSKEAFYSLYPDYGQYMWIGLYLWDSRFEGQYNGDFSRLEYGSNIYLFVPSTEKIFPSIKIFPITGQKAHAVYNIRDTIEEQFVIAKQSFCDAGIDYFQNTSFEDLAIGAMNIGLEMPSARNVSVDIESFGLYYK